MDVRADSFARFTLNEVSLTTILSNFNRYLDWDKNIRVSKVFGVLNGVLTTHASYKSFVVHEVVKLSLALLNKTLELLECSYQEINNKLLLSLWRWTYVLIEIKSCWIGRCERNWRQQLESINFCSFGHPIHWAAVWRRMSENKKWWGTGVAWR